MSWLLPPLEPHFDAALRDVTAQGMEARVAAARRLARPDNERRLDEARAGLRRLLDDPAAAVNLPAPHFVWALHTSFRSANLPLGASPR